MISIQSKIAAIALLLSLKYVQATSVRQSKGVQPIQQMKKKKAKAPPVIYDTDYGPFVDDVFALGLIINSGDLLDLKYIISTGEKPALSAQCAAKHLDLADRSDIPVGIGASFPEHSLRGGVCAIPGLVGFALEEKCNAGTPLPVDEDGIGAVAKMIVESGRDDWWYIAVGGQSTVKKLIQEYPEAAAKISTLIAMAGNWCVNFQPYPNVDAPTDETNVSCDPAASNFVVDRNVSPFQKVYFVPVEVAYKIGGKDYSKIVEAAKSGSDVGASATLDFYKDWSAAGRGNENLLIHPEAVKHDPDTESTPMFDPCAIMLAIELIDDEACENRLTLIDIEAVHFVEADDGFQNNLPNSPRSAFSLLPTGFSLDKFPDQCPNMTSHTFDPEVTPEAEMPVTVAIGFENQAAKDSFYAEMAERIAGIFGGKSSFSKCYVAGDGLRNSLATPPRSLPFIATANVSVDILSNQCPMLAAESFLYDKS